MKDYVCECGKRFNSSQSFNAHKSHCKTHYLIKYGNLELLQQRNLKINTSGQLGRKKRKENLDRKKQHEFDKWISEKHVCEHCGKVMTEKFGSGRFCCRACANARKQSETANLQRHLKLVGKYYIKNIVENKIKNNKIAYYNNPKICPVCGKIIPYEQRKNKYCSKSCFKKNLSKIAKENKTGNYGGFIWDNRKIIYKGKKLDSNYELLVAKDLDANNVKWERCKRFPYIVNNQLHHYTPDFYLPDYDIYLDPKNDFLINNKNKLTGCTDSEKIKFVSEQNNIKILILDHNHLSWAAIVALLNN